jgi:hypothetical protein
MGTEGDLALKRRRRPRRLSATLRQRSRRRCARALGSATAASKAARANSSSLLSLRSAKLLRFMVAGGTTYASPDFILRELDWRKAERREKQIVRLTASTERMTKRIALLTVANLVFVAAATILAVWASQAGPPRAARRGRRKAAYRRSAKASATAAAPRCLPVVAASPPAGIRHRERSTAIRPRATRLFWYAGSHVDSLRRSS